MELTVKIIEEGEPRENLGFNYVWLADCWKL